MDHVTYSIDIDIGGTFTDGFFTDGETVRTEKVLTTPHDISECFMSCIEAGSRAFGLELGEFLRRTGVARLSTTVGTNLLVQRAGPKLGVIVTQGHESDLYGEGGAGIVDRYVPADMIVGVGEHVDDKGALVTEVDRDEVLRVVRDLVRGGARMIVISFRNAWRNPHNERLTREIIRARYPVHYLRSVPLQLGTEVVHVADDHARTNSAVLNAYTHGEMARRLYLAEDRIRAAGYQRPLLVVHASGGNARVAKTIALNTLHSGPAVAARGAAHLSKILGLGNVVTSDMGGTSLDMSVITGGEVSFNRTPRVDGVAVATPMIEVESLGAGGGSVASVEDGSLRVGPESAGSVPGPVCYAKGGMAPTVTDANLLLGYIDPDYFLGGAMTLDRDAAERVMERRIARPLGIAGIEAAFEVRDAINRQMAERIVRRLESGGEGIEAFTLFSFGGCGPLHACAIARLAGIARIVAFPYGSVFGAFGSSTTSVRHTYARTLGISARRVAEADRVLSELRGQAETDMSGEGFDPADIAITVEVEMATNRTSRSIEVPGKRGTVAAALAKSGGRGVIDGVTVVAECAVPHWTPRKQIRSGRATPRRKGSRGVFWERGGAERTAIYDRFALRPGHSLAGPAIVEGPDTGYAIDPGWTLTVDVYGNFIIARSRVGT